MQAAIGKDVFVAHCKHELGDLIPEDARATKKVLVSQTMPARRSNVAYIH
jgi:hypothetical protein